MQQREKLSTSRGTRISALSAKEFHIHHQAMFLSIQVVQVSRHGILSQKQDLLSFGEILRILERDLMRRLRWLRIV
jgi:hypothetical protein